MIKRGPGGGTLNVSKMMWIKIYIQSGKYGTMRESNEASGVRNTHYA